MRKYRDWEELFALDYIESIPDELKSAGDVKGTTCELHQRQPRNPLLGTKTFAFDDFEYDFKKDDIRKEQDEKRKENRANLARKFKLFRKDQPTHVKITDSERELLTFKLAKLEEVVKTLQHAHNSKLSDCSKLLR